MSDTHNGDLRKSENYVRQMAKSEVAAGWSRISTILTPIAFSIVLGFFGWTLNKLYENYEKTTQETAKTLALAAEALSGLNASVGIMTARIGNVEDKVQGVMDDISATKIRRSADWKEVGERTVKLETQQSNIKEEVQDLKDSTNEALKELKTEINGRLDKLFERMPEKQSYRSKDQEFISRQETLGDLLK